MTDTAPDVQDWATDYELLDQSYAASPYAIWDDLRERCPVAHSDRNGGSWMPTTNEDVREIAKNTEIFTSQNVAVIPVPIAKDADGNDLPPLRIPPIDTDPPHHKKARRMILPTFSPRAVAERDEPYTREITQRMVDEFVARFEAGDDVIDGAVDYAQQIPPRVIAHLLGVPESMVDEFVGWVRGVLELGYFDPELRVKSREALQNYFIGLVQERMENPGDDLISQMLQDEVDGEPITWVDVANTCNLLLVAGIDTTWSSIGSAIFHLATHPEDRRRLAEDPSMIPVAVEELLRAYSPVTMARIVSEDFEYNGCPMKAGDRVIMNFPAANRDPEAFDRPDEVIIDREENRHIAFGVGIHRCAGSNQARMEMQVAIETFLARIPEFELADPENVTWAAGQVRGPRTMAIRILETR